MNDVASGETIPSTMNCRRLWNGYRCQLNRGKSHYQIAMESFAKVVGLPSLSSAAMKLAIRSHGLGSGNDAAKENSISTPSRGEAVNRGAIFTGRFFLDLSDEELWTTYRATFPEKIPAVIEDADRICRHEFNLLGTMFSYVGQPIDWHVDPASGYRWPKKLFSDLTGAARSPNGTDIKIPWELSRMQHLPTLGKAYRLTKDERYARELVAQISHWLDDNPCPYGVNWTCAMDVAIRIVNMVWGYRLIAGSEAVSAEFRSRLVESVLQHGKYIRFNLEYGLRKDGLITNGNHYLTDIVGLLHLGLLCPELAKAAEWKAFSWRALVEEMERQVHSDGVNFESSIAYHRLVVELFTAAALLCKANEVTLPETFWRRLELMYEFVLYATHPDGNVPLVGDADDGRLYILSDYGNWHRTDFRYLLSIGAVLFHRADMKAHSGGFSEEAFWLLGPSGLSEFGDLEDRDFNLDSKAFPDAGLYVMRHNDNYLLASCGKVGTAGIGNHKHNDLLSFELYAGDKAFIVDPGTYVYTRDPAWRNLFRSTAYHNTVVIDGREQNRFDPKRLFEMTPDASVIVHQWLSTLEMDRLDAEHTGYARLDPPVNHRRVFCFHKPDSSWEILDILSGEGEHTADWYFHFGAGVEIQSTGEGMFRTRGEGTNIEIAAYSETLLNFSIEEGWLSSQYGCKQTAGILHVNCKFDRNCRTKWTFGIVREI